MNTNLKGVIGEQQCILSALKAGINIYTPTDPHSVVDLVLEKDGIFKRIQVKYRGLESDSIKLSFSTVQNKKAVRIDKSKLDAFAIYNPESDKVYWVPMKDCMENTRSIQFTLEEGFKNSISKYLDPSNIWRVGE